MVRRRGLSPVLRRADRRRVGWEPGIGGTTVQTPITVTGPTLVNAGVQILADGLTLVRTRGRLTIWLTQTAAALDGFSGAFGIGVATFAAFTAGVASLPTPITEQTWDGWLYWQALHIHSNNVVDTTGSSTADFSVVGIQGLTLEFDSKAMRKLKEADVIFGAIDLVETGTATAEWWVDSRMLFKLP